jgi:hypothetical protein
MDGCERANSAMAAVRRELALGDTVLPNQSLDSEAAATGTPIRAKESPRVRAPPPECSRGRRRRCWSRSTGWVRPPSAASTASRHARYIADHVERGVRRDVAEFAFLHFVS